MLVLSLPIALHRQGAQRTKTSSAWHKNAAVPRSRSLRPERRPDPSSAQAIYLHVYRGGLTRAACLISFGPKRRAKSRHAGQSVPGNFRLLASSHPGPAPLTPLFGTHFTSRTRILILNRTRSVEYEKKGEVFGSTCELTGKSEFGTKIASREELQILGFGIRAWKDVARNKLLRI